MSGTKGVSADGFGPPYAKQTQFRVHEAGRSKGWPGGNWRASGEGRVASGQ